MRRTLAAAVVAVATALVALPVLPTAADPGGTSPTLPALPDQAASRALQVATRVLDGHPSATDPDATMALIDLRLALPRLSGLERQRAASLLARPTDPGGEDFYPNVDYTVDEATPVCGDHVCVHYVTTTPDRATSDWATTTRDTVEAVWQQEVESMGYRAPLGDGTKGGDSKLDVYLADVGSLGYYGYCAPETRKSGDTFTGYCVLDNTFKGFPLDPLPSLEVTAAHEFFHTVQFAYDAFEDRWFMESTATWMEERYADAVNDNRQYLRYGQVGKPQTSLDTFQSIGASQYGNWAFWEYLTERKGNGLVKKVWQKAASYQGAPDQYSTQALTSVLRNKGGFVDLFGSYSSALALRAQSWDEGSQWSGLGLGRPYSLTKLAKDKRKAGLRTTRLDHLASKSARFTPDASLSGRAWKLTISVDGPSRDSTPLAVVAVVKRDGSVVTSRVSLNRRGDGAKTVGFDQRSVRSVTVTLVNASTRFRCWRSSDSPYSCRGKPRDQQKPFAYAALVKRA